MINIDNHQATFDPEEFNKFLIRTNSKLRISIDQKAKGITINKEESLTEDGKQIIKNHLISLGYTGKINFVFGSDK